MPRLDRLIQVCHEQRAEALRLAVGQPAALVTNGSTRALTRDPLTDGQIAALVREVADPAAAPRLGGPEPVSFPYHSPSGPVTVAWTPGPAGPQVEIRPAPRAADGRAAVDQAEARGAPEDCAGDRKALLAKLPLDRLTPPPEYREQIESACGPAKPKN